MHALPNMQERWDAPAWSRLSECVLKIEMKRAWRRPPDVAADGVRQPEKLDEVRRQPPRRRLALVSRAPSATMPRSAPGSASGRWPPRR
jgi:hypothetical protein